MREKSRNPATRMIARELIGILFEEARLADPAYRDVAVRIVGIPSDRFVDHGSVSDLRRVLRLDAVGLADQVREALAALRATPGRSEVAAG